MPCRNEVHHVDARRKPCLEENHTLPEMVGAQAPESGCLEDDRFLFGEANFQGRCFREGRLKGGNNLSVIYSCLNSARGCI